MKLRYLLLVLMVVITTLSFASPIVELPKEHNEVLAQLKIRNLIQWRRGAKDLVLVGRLSSTLTRFDLFCTPDADGEKVRAILSRSLPNFQIEEENTEDYLILRATQFKKHLGAMQASNDVPIQALLFALKNGGFTVTGGIGIYLKSHVSFPVRIDFSLNEYCFTSLRAFQEKPLQVTSELGSLGLIAAFLCFLGIPITGVATFQALKLVSKNALSKNELTIDNAILFGNALVPRILFGLALICASLFLFVDWSGIYDVWFGPDPLVSLGVATLSAYLVVVLGFALRTNFVYQLINGTKSVGAVAKKHRRAEFLTRNAGFFVATIAIAIFNLGRFAGISRYDIFIPNTILMISIINLTMLSSRSVQANRQKNPKTA